MPWQSQHAAFCYRCQRPREEGERFSRRGRCADCGDGEMILNVRELKAHAGPRFQRWRRGVAAGVGAILVDETETID